MKPTNIDAISRKACSATASSATQVVGYDHAGHKDVRQAVMPGRSRQRCQHQSNGPQALAVFGFAAHEYPNMGADGRPTHSGLF